MKQKLFLLIAFIASLLVTQPLQPGEKYNAAFLESSRWETFFTGTVNYIEFKNGSYSIGCDGECGDDVIKGTYTLEGNKLTLIPSQARTYWNEYKVKTEWIVSEDPNNLMYLYKIQMQTKISGARNTTFWKKEPGVSAGSKRTMGNTTVIKIPFEEKKIAINAKMRKGPGQQTEFYQAKIGEKQLNYIPAGRTVNIMARTEEKEKIGDMNDYWYYCCIYWDSYTGWEDGPFYCWIYGALIAR